MLRARLAADEATLAESRGYAAHMPKVEAEDLIRAVTGPGNAVFVTDRRVLWMARNDPRWVRELPYSKVTSYSEVMHGHRYAFLIEHTPMERLEWVPAHRFFFWSWGNAEAVLLVDRSFLAFSHRDTAAAKAIRAQLDSRGIPGREPIVLPVDPRARGSGAVAILVSRSTTKRRIRRA